YTLFYSLLDRPQRVRIEFVKDDIAYTNRAQVIFINVRKVNEILNKTYDNVLELFKRPLSVEEELKIRDEVTNLKYSLSPIIVLDEFEDIRYDIEINAKIYPDNKEILIKF
ncbi:MAG: diacylglucosamine hydrolase like protein, partial [Epsilonproteobacteria bacterium]|nr:diacylglucosamine hydrolase like protein [Campylobacterota bacterium]